MNDTIALIDHNRIIWARDQQILELTRRLEAAERAIGADFVGYCASLLRTAADADAGEKIAALTSELEHERRVAEGLRQAQICVSCKGLICPPMQCGSCVETEEPAPGMPTRPVTTNLRERLANARLRVIDAVDRIGYGVRDSDMQRILDAIDGNDPAPATPPAKDDPPWDWSPADRAKLVVGATVEIGVDVNDVWAGRWPFVDLLGDGRGLIVKHGKMGDGGFPWQQIDPATVRAPGEG